jgi:hypothetical protein
MSMRWSAQVSSAAHVSSGKERVLTRGGQLISRAYHSSVEQPCLCELGRAAVLESAAMHVVYVASMLQWPSVIDRHMDDAAMPCLSCAVHGFMTAEVLVCLLMVQLGVLEVCCSSGWC